MRRRAEAAPALSPSVHLNHFHGTHPSRHFRPGWRPGRYHALSSGGALRITLKYGPRGEQVLTNVKRQSKPGRRVYRAVDALPRHMQGPAMGSVSHSR
ncbi:30S ribosomal protein S8, partial [Lacticaseibacillus rhamnosus]